MEALNLTLLLKAFLRVAPMVLLIRTPLSIPLSLRFLFSLPLALVLMQRLSENYMEVQSATVGVLDLLLGLGVGVFMSLFFAASMKLSLFFVQPNEELEEISNPWRELMDSFFFIFAITLFMSLKLERNFIEILAVETLPAGSFMNTTLWSTVLTDVSWLALKVSSFGFLFSLTKGLFEEVYRRLGGESLRIVFSVCTWLMLLVMSPFLIPSFSSFISGEMSEFWKKWLGVL
ncbi:MAG: hypothetical protein R3A80_06445 [Bdellovibrionota bacterium]